MCKTSETRNKLVCQYCKKALPVPGRKGCAPCMESNKLHARARRNGFVRKGLCAAGDGERRARGRRFCSDCLDVARIKQQILRAAA